MIADTKRQLASIEFEIRNVIDVVKGGYLSQALSEALKELEARQATLQETLKQAQSRLGVYMTPQRMVHQITAYANQFDTLWNKQGTPQEQKTFLRNYIQQIRVERREGSLRALFGLYKIPLSITQQTPAKIGVSPVSTEVCSGGPHLTSLEPPKNCVISYREYNIKSDSLGNWKAVAVA